MDAISIDYMSVLVASFFCAMARLELVHTCSNQQRVSAQKPRQDLHRFARRFVVRFVVIGS